MLYTSKFFAHICNQGVRHFFMPLRIIHYVNDIISVPFIPAFPLFFCIFMFYVFLCVSPVCCLSCVNGPWCAWIKTDDKTDDDEILWELW